MKYLICAAALAAVFGTAQAASPSAKKGPPPNEAALGQTLIETLQAEVQWRSNAIAEYREIAALKKEVATLKGHPAPAKK